MKTTGQLRILVRELIREITDPNIIQYDDIRYLKNNNGVFPLKMIWSGGQVGLGEFSETPYVPTDTFIIFDIFNESNKVQETIENRTTSHLNLRLIINIYGDSSEDVVQYMLARLFQFDVQGWMTERRISLSKEPDAVEILDGRENAEWWKRRRVVLNLNTQQEFIVENETLEKYSIRGFNPNIEFEGDDA